LLTVDTEEKAMKSAEHVLEGRLSRLEREVRALRSLLGAGLLVRGAAHFSRGKGFSRSVSSKASGSFCETAEETLARFSLSKRTAPPHSRSSPKTARSASGSAAAGTVREVSESETAPACCGSR
jgi:hypothetical protein